MANLPRVWLTKFGDNRNLNWRQEVVVVVVVVVEFIQLCGHKTK